MTGNKIFKKLFFMTLGFGLSILAIQFLLQFLFLDDYYNYNKAKTIEKRLDYIAMLLETEVYSEAEINSELGELDLSTQSKTTVVSIYSDPIFGVGSYDRSIYMTVLSEDNEVYQVYLDDYWEETEFLEALDKGKEVRVKGYPDQEFNTFYPEWVTIDDKDYGIEVENISFITGDILEEEETILEDDSFEEDFFFEDPIVINGFITFLHIPSQTEYDESYKESKLFDEQLAFFSENKEAVEELKNERYVIYNKLDTYTDIDNMISVRLVEDIYGETLFIFNIFSLQTVNASTSIMQSFFYLTVVIALILSVIVSYVFSKKLTKPLIHLDSVTKRLADLDFNQRCEVNTKDEIQDLAENINIMSDRLEHTLNQLKQFLADASHELKTPLTVMKGIVEGMMDGVYDVNDPENFKRMSHEINDMSQLVYDLLELSKLESGEIEFSQDVFQLSDVVLKTHHKFQPLIKEKSIEVKLDLDEYFVRANEAHIETVVRNFYANAIQYTPNGGRIDIQMLEEEKHVQFLIENSPSHINEAALDKLWQPFFREDQSRNKKLGGTGLGLYMVRQILERHQSSYKIENTENGVKVTFTLNKIEAETEL